ncbi:phosphate transporter PHO1-like protein, partial [Trifolium pratense]
MQQKESMMSTEVDPNQQTNRSTHHDDEAHSNYKRSDPMEILEHVKIDNALESPVTIKNVFTDSNDNNELSFNKEELRKVEKQLRLVFVEFYQKLLHLKDYSFMNLSAFSKIMKKYEKNASRGASAAYMRVVDNSYLGTSDETVYFVVSCSISTDKMRYRINYPFLFGIKSGTELDHRDIFLLTTGHAVIAVLCFLINLQLEMNQKERSYKTATELVPLSLIVVTLMDFFLADQLTSQFQAFRSIVLYICYYGLGEHSRRQNKCRSHGIYNVQYFIVGVIPYWFRLAQCMRQLYDEREIDHAINGSKYLSTIIAMVIRTTFETKKAMTWKVLALISSAVSILLNTYWDIVKDWSLLQRHSKNPYLRDKLVVSHKSVYYIAMVVNAVLRLSWMQLVLELHWRPLHRVAIITFISCLEIIRRGIWNFF